MLVILIIFEYHKILINIKYFYRIKKIIKNININKILKFRKQIKKYCIVLMRY